MHLRHRTDRRHGQRQGPERLVRGDDRQRLLRPPGPRARPVTRLNIDFLAPDQGPSARVALELTAETARALAAAIESALAAVPAELIE